MFDAIDHSQVSRKINEYCRIAKVSRAGFYKHMQTAKDNKDEQIAEEVIRIQNEFGHRVGILKTWALLKQRGISVGHNKLARIMSEYSLNPTFNRKRYPQDYYTQKKERRRSQERVNSLSREFASMHPGQKLVTDITYVRVIGGWLYLSAIIDLFNGDVVAFRMAKRLDVDLAIQTLNALSESGYKHEEACIFHSDQGFTYTHERFVTALKNQGFLQSFSRVGNCWDNACVESFFGHLKAELGITHQKTMWSYEVAEKMIEEYVEYYRTKRIQARLGYRTPQQVLLDYQASLN